MDQPNLSENIPCQKKHTRTLNPTNSLFLQSDDKTGMCHGFATGQKTLPGAQFREEAPNV